jgi:hypothetical protein
VAGDVAGGEPGSYSPLLCSCDRCGCPVADTPGAHAAHDRHHDGLRALWSRTGGDAAPPARRRVDPRAEPPARRSGRW